MGKIVGENPGIWPLLTLTAHPIRVGSGSGSGSGRGSGRGSGSGNPATLYSYRVGSGSEEWPNSRVFTDHFAHFSFSTSYIKSSFGSISLPQPMSFGKMESGQQHW